MKDFPFFTTQNGIASLTLKEIPYTKAAYITIRDTQQPEELLEECIAFCKMAGAEEIFASNHSILYKYPLHTQIIRMSRPREGLQDTDAALFPVGEKTVNRWCEIYNERMRRVPNFSYMSFIARKELLKKGNGYFVHRGETLLGIGIASGEMIDAVVSVKPGAGETVLLALNHALSGNRAVLEVASTNEKAIRLYERLGFIKSGCISQWHRLV